MKLHLRRFWVGFAGLYPHQAGAYLSNARAYAEINGALGVLASSSHSLQRTLQNCIFRHNGSPPVDPIGDTSPLLALRRMSCEPAFTRTGVGFRTRAWFGS
jgi:hypothetical protein